LDKFLSQQKVLWTEAQRISFLAEGIAREFNLDRQDRDLAQIGGLLSPLGRIVVSYLHPKLDGRIKAFCRAKKISPIRFNDLTQTINPAELGARVAEKWDFPANLVAVLRYQTRPDLVAESLGQVTHLVHLAVRLNSLEQGIITASQIEAPVLKALKLDGPGTLESLRSRIDRGDSVS
jgi:HD-like signal output (HDOD) protein